MFQLTLCRSRIFKRARHSLDHIVPPLRLRLRPVDNEVTPLCAVLIPVEADVDSDVTELLVALRPVDSEPTPRSLEHASST